MRRKLPQIPLARNFVKWSLIGKNLFKLHCNFDSVKKYELQRVTTKLPNSYTPLSFKKNKKDITIIIDNSTLLKGVPLDVLEWTFKSKTPLEWILDYYKDTKNKIKPQSCNDEKIRKKFNTYRFSDYKEDVIVLLKRVTTVCVETVQLRNELKAMEWGPQPELKLTPIKKLTKKPGRKTDKTKAVHRRRRVSVPDPDPRSVQVRFSL